MINIAVDLNLWITAAATCLDHQIWSQGIYEWEMNYKSKPSVTTQLAKWSSYTRYITTFLNIATTLHFDSDPGKEMRHITLTIVCMCNWVAI